MLLSWVNAPFDRFDPNFCTAKNIAFDLMHFKNYGVLTLYVKQEEEMLQCAALSLPVVSTAKYPTPAVGTSHCGRCYPTSPHAPRRRT